MADELVRLGHHQPVHAADKLLLLIDGALAAGATRPDTNPGPIRAGAGRAAPRASLQPGEPGAPDPANDGWTHYLPASAIKDFQDLLRLKGISKIRENNHAPNTATGRPRTRVNPKTGSRGDTKFGAIRRVMTMMIGR